MTPWLIPLSEFKPSSIYAKMSRLKNRDSQGSYSFVLAMNDKYQGFGCALSDK